MRNYPDECKKGKHSDIHIALSAKELKNVRRASYTTGLKTVSPRPNEQPENRQIDDDLPEPKEPKLFSSKSRNTKTQVAGQYDDWCIDYIDQYLMKEEVEEMNIVKKSKMDLNCSIHRITSSKDGLHNLIGSDDTMRIVDTIPEVSHFNDTPSNINLTAGTYRDTNGLQRQLVYEQNPITGKFFRSSITHQEITNESLANLSRWRDVEMERYQFVLSLLLGFAGLVYLFTSGMLAGFSMYTLFGISNAYSDEILRLHNNGSAITRFYLVSTSLCLTGIIVQGNVLRRVTRQILDLSLLLVCCQCTALVLTQSIAKLEINLQNQSNDVHSSNLAMNGVAIWKNLNIIRSVLCIIQWFIICGLNVSNSRNK